MPPLAPGVYIEELPAQMTPIVGVDTRTAGFIGVSQQGPAPVLVTSFAEFLTLAVLHPSQFLSLAVQGFFNNGGNRCYVVSIMPTAPLQPVMRWARSTSRFSAARMRILSPTPRPPWPPTARI